MTSRPSTALFFLYSRPAFPLAPCDPFVWSPGEGLPAGTGGSENFTVGQVRD